MGEQAMWVDVRRCTGCGACAEVCPVGAIAMVDGKACVDEETCTGCEICMDVCPEGAIQPVIQGELVPAPKRSAPTVYRPAPLAQTAGAAVVVAGTGLVVRAAQALGRAVVRWLARRPEAAAGSPVRGSSRAGGGERGGGGGRRRRRRGG